MPLVAAYHRPQDLGHAVTLMAEPGRIVLAGGTIVNADREPSELEAVDLQACGLDGIEVDGEHLRIGAMVTLDALRRSDLTPQDVGEVARRELPSTLRTLATVGGTVAAGETDSMMLAALLAHDAVVETASDGDRKLDALLVEGVGSGRIVVAVTIDRSGETATAVTGRTPADVPIVGVYGRRTAAGLRIALSGVADRPVLVDPAHPVADLDPPADFRGSAEYRLELASVLTARVVGALG